MATLPTININGTDGRELMTSYLEAYRAAVALEELLAKLAPHGRDYPEAYDKAREEHEARRLQARAIGTHMMDVALGIYDQIERK